MSDTQFSLSESAAKRISFLAAKEAKPVMMRVAVLGGGCSGFQYNFSFEEGRNDDDLVIERSGAAVLVDATSLELLKGFHQTHGDVIFKPLDGMGGSSIFRLRKDDPNVSVIIETLTGHGRTPIMAQRFIPEIVNGDKRILLVDGEPVPYALARVPARGETRGNLAAGGSGVPQPLSERDRWIAAQVKDVVREKGLLFVGLDVIGDYLTEINVTSPTCVRELNKAYDLDIAGDLMNVIERKLHARGS